jgi:hypothetical protein
VHHGNLVPAERLLAGLPLLPVPATLIAAGPGHAPRLLPHLARARHARGLARTAAYLQPKVIASSIALVACAAAGTVAVVHGHAATATTTSTPRATGPAVSQLKSYLQAVYDRYRLPVWLTEFALASFSGTRPSRPASSRPPS